MAKSLRLTFTARVCAPLALLGAALAAPAAASAADYLIVYKREAIPAGAKARVAEADGRLVHAYGEIGVAVARSGDRSFRGELLEEDPRVAGVLAADAYSFIAPGASDAFEVQEGDLPNAPATDADVPLSAQQWNSRQIQAPEAHAITGGSPLVTVADLDSGVDFRHPDLAANIDFLRSANCQSGVPVTDPSGTAWDDNIGHGTFTAGLIAAASNGVGMVGIAPNVKLAAVKISNDRGTILWPAVVCGLVHAGRTH
ncbi:MAG: S8 family serine peptidase, partial [Actinobacteria bacterium]|nr:S8 family serine peptidase [Actinomycetota bacterium]